ncbi:hypothetical protein VU13_02625, partial [Desulfobulbus sp. US5]|nr:hypothetical protein [Desulfobulbus sp. US5]
RGKSNGCFVSGRSVFFQSRIKASDKADAVDIDIRLDAQLLNDTGQVINEGISNVFAGIANNSGTAGGPVPEQINDKPTDYTTID